ncbi:MAG TPA: bifunctional sugar-1-phosphate nucleotidylyltransferase/acetyltransferase [Methanoregula sp.]|nr:bifunctional sugar-1-phosphate nucleotidylyltransferase/acetyltransferase [Methanoregula sp.]
MQAVILAAGEGKRVRPLTRSRPKAMIPVANRPIIAYVIDALVKNGIRDIIVVVGYRKEQVTRFLNQLEIPVSVVVQDKQLGTAHALKCAESSITGDFLLLPGDNYIDHHSIARIKETRNAMLVKDHPSPSNFGVVTLRDNHVTSIVEKPQHSQSFMVSTGIYSLTKQFFGFIRETDVTDAVTRMLAAGEKIQAVAADDWQDAIYPWDLLRMNARLLRTLPSTREGTASRQATVQGTVQVGKGTMIDANTVIRGPVVIGNDCVVGPNCCIMPNTSIGSRVTIEPFTYVGNSLIMDDAGIGSHSRIVDAIIGERCSLADHTSTATGESLMEIEETVIRPGFGAVLGDQVSSGSNTVFRNCIVGNNVKIGPAHSVASSILPDDTVVI